MSNNAIELVESIKQISVGAMDSEKPVEVTIGTVKSVNPLKVMLSGGFVVSEGALILSRNVTDHKFEMRLYNNGSGTFQTYEIKNSLKVGEKVSITRLQGGKKYLIQDRVGM